MEQLIPLLIDILVLGILAWAMYMVCTKFLANFPPALWICGVVLLILIIAMFTGSIPAPWHLHTVR